MQVTDEQRTIVRAAAKEFGTAARKVLGLAAGGLLTEVIDSMLLALAQQQLAELTILLHATEAPQTPIDKSKLQ